MNIVLRINVKNINTPKTELGLIPKMIFNLIILRKTIKSEIIEIDKMIT
jgi:hypothetical protein